MDTPKKQISEMDEKYLKIIRHSVTEFVDRCAKEFDKDGTLLLDVAPQDHEGATPFFVKAKVETLDIDEASGATYIADLCANNQKLIESQRFDYVVCTEVLEHTLRPFKAVDEIFRIIKTGGFAFITAPFNFRIHGPLPDCWRFTEHGLRSLFEDFEIVELQSVETEDRFLMPIHYTLIARKA
jgi:2-polyprenyl-3-methyl-5-hydroxy-6-metoxy-1,4-benzoquinol methylase